MPQHPHKAQQIARRHIQQGWNESQGRWQSRVDALERDIMDLIAYERDVVRKACKVTVDPDKVTSKVPDTRMEWSVTASDVAGHHWHYKNLTRHQAYTRYTSCQTSSHPWTSARLEHHGKVVATWSSTPTPVPDTRKKLDTIDELRSKVRERITSVGDCWSDLDDRVERELRTAILAGVLDTRSDEA